MARNDARLGWPPLVAVSTVLVALTLGTFSILGKNFANTFALPGSHQFESVGPAANANIVGQLAMLATVAVLAKTRPTWRSTAFLAVPFVSLAIFVASNTWAQSSIIHY